MLKAAMFLKLKFNPLMSRSLKSASIQMNFNACPKQWRVKFSLPSLSLPISLQSVVGLPNLVILFCIKHVLSFNELFLFRWTDQSWSLSNERTTDQTPYINCQIRFGVVFPFCISTFLNINHKQRRRFEYIDVVMIELYLRQKPTINWIFIFRARHHLISSVLIESSKVI